MSSMGLSPDMDGGRGGLPRTCSPCSDLGGVRLDKPQSSGSSRGGWLSVQASQRHGPKQAGFRASKQGSGEQKQVCSPLGAETEIPGSRCSCSVLTPVASCSSEAGAARTLWTEKSPWAQPIMLKLMPLSSRPQCARLAEDR